MCVLLLLFKEKSAGFIEQHCISHLLTYLFRAKLADVNLKKYSRNTDRNREAQPIGHGGARKVFLRRCTRHQSESKFRKGRRRSGVQKHHK